MQFEFHPVADLFPISANRRAKLREEIVRNGCPEPVVLWQGQVMYGRPLIEICEELAKEFPSRGFEGTEDQAIEYALSLNHEKEYLG